MSVHCVHSLKYVAVCNPSPDVLSSIENFVATVPWYFSHYCKRCHYQI